MQRDKSKYSIAIDESMMRVVSQGQKSLGDLVKITMNRITLVSATAVRECRHPEG